MQWRRSDTVAVVLIWTFVFVAALVVAVVFADDDPATDEGAGAGALAFVVGGALTGTYLAVRYRRSIVNELKREAGAAPRRETVDIAGAIVLGVVGIVIAVIAGVSLFSFEAYFCGLLLGGGFVLVRRLRRKRAP
jgi:hypothetical protein